MRLFFIIGLFFLSLAPTIELSAQMDEKLIDIQRVEIEGDFLDYNVSCMLQDSRGFLWFGTDHGLCRYDGHKIKTFTTSNSQLKENIVHELIEDDQGFIWSIKRGDTDIFRTVKNIDLINIYTLDIKSLNSQFSSSTIDIERKYKITQGTNKEIHLFDRDSDKSYLCKNGEIISKASNAKNIFSKRRIYDGTVNELALECLSSKEIAKNNFSVQIKDTVVNSQFLHIDNEGNHVLFHAISHKSIFFPQIKNIRKYREAFIKVSPAGTIVPFSFKNAEDFKEKVYMPHLESAYYDKHSGRYWYKYGERIEFFEENDNYIIKLSDVRPDINFEPISQIYFTSNLTWICTSGGVYTVNFRKKLFDTYMNRPLDGGSDKFYSFRAIHTKDNVSITASTIDSLFLIKSKKISKRSLNSTIVLLPEEGDDFVGFSWGLAKINNHKYTTYPIIGDGIPWSMVKDSTTNTYWVGTHKGLFYWKEGMKNTLKFKGLSELDNSNIFYIHALKNGNFLFATEKGIYEFSTKERIINRYWKGGKGNSYLPYDEYFHIFEDTEGTFWLGSNSGGLIEWDKSTGKYTQFSTKDGLSSDIICSTYEDDSNNLWISSYYGLMCMNKTSKNVRVYTEEDGLPNNEFNRASHFKAPDGKLYFGGLNGFISFYPKDLIANNQIEDSPLELTKVSHFDVQKDDLIDKTGFFLNEKSIKLQPGEGFLKIEYALLDYQAKDEIIYAYQIQGQSAKWYYTKHNDLLINGLPYGDYTIRIKGKMVNGQYSKNELKIPLEVIRPIYLTWWFILLTLIALVGGVFAFFKSRTKRLLKQRKELERLVFEQTQQLQEDKKTIEEQASSLRELDKSKSRFFANVSHELRTPITLIKGPIEDIIKSDKLDNQNLNLIKIASQNIKSLLALVDEILDLTRLESGKLTLNESSEVFYLLIRRIISNFQSIASIKDIEIIFKYEPNSDLQIKLDSDKFEKILNNLLSNALKFTPKSGHIEIHVKDKGSHLLIEVKDNGRGIPAADLPFIFDRYYQSSTNNKAEGGLGIGLSLSMDFVKLFQGEMWVESTTEGIKKGTSFFFKFPKQEVLSMLTTEDKLAINQIDEVSVSLDEEHSITANSKQEKETILLVEDNQDLRKYIKMLLDTNYNVCLAENGKEALTLLNDRKDNLPSLIISDVMMPIMDGFELLEILKSTAPYLSIPVIMLTARGNIDDRLKALRIGVDDYLTKPFISEELKVRIENLLKNAKNRNIAKTELNTVGARSQTLNKELQEWLQKLETTILNNLSNTNYSLDQIALDMHLSTRQLHRRIKQNIGQTPNQYIKTLRLNQAHKLLESEPNIPIKKLAFDVGFKDVVYFSRQFKEYFGKLPSEM